MRSARPTSEAVSWRGLGDYFKSRHWWDVIRLVLNGFLGTFKSIYCTGKTDDQRFSSDRIVTLWAHGPLPPIHLSMSFSLFLSVFVLLCLHTQKEEKKHFFKLSINLQGHPHTGMV